MRYWIRSEADPAANLARSLEDLLVNSRCGEGNGGFSNRIGGWPTDAEIGEAFLRHKQWIVQIASVDNNWIAKGFIDAVKIQSGELRPVGQNKKCIHVLGRGIGTVGISQVGAGRQDFSAALDGCGIERDDGATFGEQHFDEVDRRRLANIVGLTFEGQAKNTEAFTAERPKRGPDFAEKARLLLDIDLLDLSEQAEVDAELFGDGAKRGDIFRKTGATIAYAGAKKSRANAAVETHPLRNLLDVRVGCFAEVGDSVDERYFEREKGVGGMLDNLGALGRGEEEGWRLLAAARSRDSG